MYHLRRALSSVFRQLFSEFFERRILALFRTIFAGAVGYTATAVIIRFWGGFSANSVYFNPLRGYGLGEMLRIYQVKLAGACVRGSVNACPLLSAPPATEAEAIDRQQHRKRFGGAFSSRRRGCSSPPTSQQRGNAHRRERAGIVNGESVKA